MVIVIGNGHGDPSSNPEQGISQSREKAWI